MPKKDCTLTVHLSEKSKRAFFNRIVNKDKKRTAAQIVNRFEKFFSRKRSLGTAKCIYCGQTILKSNKKQCMCIYCYLAIGQYERYETRRTKHINIPPVFKKIMDTYFTIEGYLRLHKKLLQDAYNRQMGKESLHCKMCGKPLTGKNIRVSREYCSERCCQKHYNLRRQKKAKEKFATCLTCKKKFKVTYRHKVYCSDKCKVFESDTSFLEAAKVCPICGGEFSNSISQKKYCSEKCAKVAASRCTQKSRKKRLKDPKVLAEFQKRQREYRKKRNSERKREILKSLGPRKCKQCGKRILKSAHLRQKFCSKDCNMHHWREHHKS